MLSVADPLPALASTTTVPAFWIFSVSTFFSASLNVTAGVVCAHTHVRTARRGVWSVDASSPSARAPSAWDRKTTRTCERSGRMVAPAWPPMTGTSTSLRSRPLASATNVLARTTSSVVTPSTWSPQAACGPREARRVLACAPVPAAGFERPTTPRLGCLRLTLRGSYTPSFLSVSAAMGTVELTGLVTMVMTAPGANLATFSTRFLTMPAAGAAGQVGRGGSLARRAGAQREDLLDLELTHRR